MRNKLLRNIVIFVAFAMFFLTVLILVSFVVLTSTHTKEQVREFATVIVEQVNNFESISDKDKFIAYRHGSSMSITLISCYDGAVTDDTTGKEYLYVQNLANEENVAKLLNSEVGTVIEKNIKSPYSTVSGYVYAYYTKVYVGNNVDPSEYMIIRITSASAVASTPFRIIIFALILFWLLMIGIIIWFLSINVKASLAPLKTIEKIMIEIRNGDYTGYNVSQALISSESDKMVEEIANIATLIGDSLRDLEIERNKVTSILNTLNQGVVVFDKDGNVVETNKMAEELTGFKVTSRESIKEDEASAKIYPNIYSAFMKRKYYSTIYQSKTGKWLKVEAIFPNNEFSATVYMILVLTDMTDEVKNAKIMADFFANASHELKTPLTAISGYSEMLNYEGATEKQKAKCATEIHKSTTRMKNLLDDMLQLSRMDAIDNITELKIEPIELGDIARDLVQELEVLAKKANVTLSFKGNAAIEGHYDSIKSMMRNLISNAIKYNKKGGHVYITLEETDDKSILKVKDDGIGIAEEDIPQLFDRFYKADKAHSATEVESSTGLGLSIVKNVVNIHGANIEVNSKLGEGTEFIVTFKREVK